MTDFRGFREGCIGSKTIDDTSYSSVQARFEIDGKAAPAILAGELLPDAIRIVPQDITGSPMWRDTVLAFSDQQAAKQVDRQDGRIPEGNIRTLSEDEIKWLNSLCRSCIDQDSCPVLDGILALPEPTELPAFADEQGHLPE